MDSKTFFAAPLYSLFSTPFYERVLRAKFSQAFLYLIYLAALFSVLLTIVMGVFWMPKADQFVEWFKGDMPGVTWTQEGIELDQDGEYKMTHPDYGTVVVFDDERIKVTRDEMGEAFAYVTRERVYLRQGDGGLESREIIASSISSQGGGVDLPEAIRLQANMIDKVYEQMKKAAYPVVFLISFIFTFFANLFFVLFLSVVSYSLAQMREDKLSFEKSFIFASFALTLTLLIILISLTPALITFQYTFGLAFLLTCGLLFYQLRATDISSEPESDSTPSF